MYNREQKRPCCLSSQAQGSNRMEAYIDLDIDVDLDTDAEIDIDADIDIDTDIYI